MQEKKEIYEGKGFKIEEIKFGIFAKVEIKNELVV